MLVWKILNVFLLLMLLDVTRGSNIEFYEDDANGLREEGKGVLTCQCGYPEQVTKLDLDIATAENIFFAAAMSHSNKVPQLKDGTSHFSDIKERIKNCTWCQVDFTKCTGDSNSTDYYCVRETAFFTAINGRNNTDNGDDIRYGEDKPLIVKQKTDYFPKLVDIPIGANGKNQRQIRRATACSYPSSLTTAAIRCRIYPSSIKCIQRCVFGYTLEKGIDQAMQCTFKDNKWKPTGFKECQPFVDCTLSLITGGSMKCKTPLLSKGPECAVECLHYEDKPAVPKKTYTCNIDGKWDPPLPFCVKPGTGLVLVKAPAEKLHKD